MNDKSMSFKGKIKNCVYDSPDYKMYGLEVDKDLYPNVKFTKYGTVLIKGQLHSLGVGQPYEIKGIEENDKYGYSYKVSNIRMDKPINEHDIFIFLQEILTQNQAAQLYQHYPDIIDRVINNNLDDIDLSKLNGIGEVTFEKIKSKIVENFCLTDIVAEFGGILSMNIIKKLYEHYASVQMIKNKLSQEPYKCLCNLNRIGFITADDILLTLEKNNKLTFNYDLKTSKQRCLACIIYLLEKNEENGNTRMKLIDLKKQCDKLTPSCANFFVECMKDESIYYNIDKMIVALKKTYDMEYYIADEILKGLGTPRIWNFDWKSYKTKGSYELSNEQLELLRLACTQNIFILEGAAGCGKSSSTEELIQMLKDNDKTFMLCCPTGKGAKVLSDFSHEDAKTIHRGLIYNPATGWGYNKEHKLDIDFLLIDEFSMVGVFLMSHIIDAIDFNRTKLCLVGDPNQLPSIECGNLLHDFIVSNIIPKATLTKVFRYGSNGLLTVATDIRKCKEYLKKDSDKITAIGDAKDYVFIKSDDENVINESVAIYKKLITTGYNGKIYNPSDVVILTSYNKGDYGTTILNKKLQEIANKHYGDSNKFQAGDCIYYQNDIIMQKQNNYNAELDSNDKDNNAFIANGECGYIEYISNKYIVMNIGGIKVKYYKNDMNNAGLGYSYTVHRSQGSSIKAVIFITPRSHTFFLNSNLLYVGITRSVDCCFHLGDIKTVASAIHKKANLVRNTFIQELLKI